MTKVVVVVFDEGGGVGGGQFEYIFMKSSANYIGAKYR